MERFSCRTAVVSGKGALAVLGEGKYDRLLIVMHSQSRHMTGRIRRAAGDPDTRCFEDLDREPTVRQAVTGSRIIKEFQPDLVVALGGREVLDCGKAMVCFSGHSCTLAAVPMAFGCGSELTDRVTLTHEGRRNLLCNSGMLPDLVILEPELTTEIQPNGCGEGGFEILAAALESYTVSGGGTLRDIHAKEGFSACWAALPAAVAGNTAARHRLQQASALTGMAVAQTGLGLCRAMENSLGTVFGLSRGKAAGILLPAIVGCNAHAAGRRYAELSRAAGLGGSREELGVRNLRGGLIRLRQELGLPGSLVQAGVDLRTIWSSGKRVAELTLEDPECRNNPMVVDDFTVRRILEEITGRI